MVINPYTFLPVSDLVIRRAPHGHAGLAPGRFSGSFQVRLTARTPLLIGPLGNGDVMPPTTADGATPIIPGSSLAGAVRSIHEAMNNSCLRVVDEGYRAVHRLAVSPDLLKDTASQRLRMAVVTAVTEHGLPSRVALCDKVVWVPSDKFSFPPQTGDRVALPEEPQTDRPHQRPDRLHPDAPSVGKSERPRWTVLVTDLAARRPDHPVYFACGRLELQTIGGAPRPVQVSVPDLTQAALARAIETSADLHGDKPPATVAGYVEVIRGHHLLGRRLALWHDDTSMTPIPLGTPIWVQLRDVPSGREVSEIRLSLAWRRTSDSTAQDRIPESLRPCQHKDKLCPSCLVFGSAGSDDQDPDGPTEQNSYRGHVRFADALADHPVHKERFRRAPLASPKPTAGQFYLDNSAAEGRFHPTTPLAQWDSMADYRKDGELDARRIRGRKFYWRTRDNGILPGPQHRGRHWGSRNDAMGDEVTVMAVGSTFTTRVTFDNLTTAQIGSLLAALDPSQALGGKCVISVGGGRPFGWGGVAATISEFTAQSATSRYAGSPAASPTTKECVTAYRDSMAGQPGRSEWDTLAKLLTVNPPGVQDAHVWYPPNPRPGFQRGTQRYDEGFEFWQKSNGFELTKPPHRPLKSLPQADAADQNIPGVL